MPRAIRTSYLKYLLNGIVATMKNRFGQLFAGTITLSNQSLKKWSVVLAAVYLVQGSAVLLLSNLYTLPVMVSFPAADSLQSQLTHHTVRVPAMHQLFTVNVAYLVAAFL